MRRPQPGVTAVDIDADHGIIESAVQGEADLPAVVYRPTLNTISLGRIDWFTPEQRKKLLRARLQG